MEESIGIASDHGGAVLKSKIIKSLRSWGHLVKDFGVDPNAGESVDYPDYAQPLAREISSGQRRRGILICGSGIGMSIAANRFANVRATLVWSEQTAELCRQHNDSNILVLGERVLDHEAALRFVEIWLSTPFEPRHQRRLDKIEKGIYQ